MKELKFVAFRGKSWVSKAIRYFTRSKDYSHIAILMEEQKGILIEAWTHGGLTQWTDYSSIDKHTPGTKYEIWTLEVPDDVYEHCMNYYKHHAEQKTRYYYAGILGFIFKKSVKQNKNKLFCNEEAITPLCEAMPWAKIVPSNTNPETFIYIIQAAGGYFRAGTV